MMKASDDVSTTTPDRDLASPADIKATSPPDMYFRSAAADVSAAARPPQSSSSGVDDDPDELERWKRWIGAHDGMKRMILCTSRLLDWRDERDPLIIVGIVTLLFLLVRSMSSSAVFSVGLTGFVLCLFEFIRMQPAVNDYINKLTQVSSEDERELQSTYGRMFNARRRLIDTTHDLIELRRDRPTAFLLVMICIFLLLLIVGQYVDGLTLIYIIGLVSAQMPGLTKRIGAARSTDVAEIAKAAASFS